MLQQSSQRLNLLPSRIAKSVCAASANLRLVYPRERLRKAFAALRENCLLLVQEVN
jgi:hypothetical protein